MLNKQQVASNTTKTDKTVHAYASWNSKQLICKQPNMGTSL